jgi:transcription elongation factor/antiterminator RfaH
VNRWYIILTKPHKENDVTVLLSKPQFAIFHPRLADGVRAGKPVRATSLFPRYLFVQTDLTIAQNFQLIRYTRGVSKILCRGGKPVPIAEEIVRVIQERTTPEGVVLRQAFFKHGELVRVRRGILKDLIGILERPVPGEGRVQVLLNLVNYKIKAKLSWTDVERIREK